MLCQGAVLRTAEPGEERREGPGLLRVVESGELRVEHLLFAPLRPRPLRLALVWLESRSDQTLVVDYSETWDLERTGYRAAEAAAIAETAEGERALADVSVAPRARPPREPPALGLALDLRLALPPRERRPLSFAYVAPEPGEDPARLVRAWRGGVAEELARTLRAWRESEGS